MPEAPDYVAILEAARLGVCNPDVKEEMDLSDAEAGRLYEVIVEMQAFGSEL